MLGTIVGDIVGSPFEFVRHKSKSFELFSSASNFTDDTICLIAVADSLLGNTDPSESLRAWCRKYPNPTGGYGGRFGNGCSMTPWVPITASGQARDRRYSRSS